METKDTKTEALPAPRSDRGVKSANPISTSRRMNEITAYGQPFTVLRIIEGLKKLNLQPLSINVLEVLDFGGERAVPRGEGDFVKKWKLEVLVENSAYEAVVVLICDVLRDGGRSNPQITVVEVRSGFICIQ